MKKIALTFLALASMIGSAYADGGTSFTTGSFSIFSSPGNTLPDSSKQQANITEYTYIIEDSQTGEQYILLMLPNQQPIMTHRVGAKKPVEVPPFPRHPKFDNPRECSIRTGFLCFFNWVVE